MLMARFTSPLASGSVLPSSRVISSLIFARRLSTSSAALKRYSPRRGAGIADQAVCALAAASHASLTSSAPDDWNSPTISPVLAGLTLGNVFLDLHSVHWPPM